MRDSNCKPFDCIGLAEWDIIKYDVRQDEWSGWIKYEDNAVVDCPVAAFDAGKQKIYVFSSTTKMMIINAVNHKCAIKEDTFDGVETGEHSLVCANGKTHLIGGYDKNVDHRIWNDETLSFDVAHKFKEYRGVLSAQTVYVPSKEIILLIGGYQDTNDFPPLDKMWSYSLKTGEWSPIDDVKIDDSLDMSNHACILTSDEKYVIIAGSDENDRGFIHVLEIGANDKYKL